MSMRGPELAEPKANDVRRLVFVGDSSISGVDVVAAAVPGYSSTQCRKVLENELDGLHPSIRGHEIIARSLAEFIGHMEGRTGAVQQEVP